MFMVIVTVWLELETVQEAGRPVFSIAEHMR
jgi:hypothetical protein